jgi:hypothetical protein
MQAPIGGISSVALYIVSVYLDIWSKLDAVRSVLLALALLFLFLWDYMTYE